MLEKIKGMLYNMDISLIMSLKCLKFPTHVGKIHFERSLSQNVDIGICFCFVLCRRWHSAKFIEKITKATRFLLKNKN